MVLICLVLLFIMSGVQSYDTNKKIRERDNNPYNTVKSDRWKREHGLL